MGLYPFDANWHQILLKLEVLMLITLKILKWPSAKNVKFRLRSVQILAILLLKFYMIFGQQKVIVIDPGHGGKDSGAVGINGVLEKDVVLNIAKEIIILNEILFEGEFDMYLTRPKDSLISLYDRTKFSKTLKADVFISLHCNASKTSSKGIDVYLHNTSDEKVNIKKSIALGLSILEQSTLKLGFKKRGVKFADFQVLRETITYSPSVLVEMGFLTNTDEADYFLAANNIKAMALAILMGIINYLNTGL